MWDCELSITDSEPVILPCNFNSQLLAIDISVSNQRARWYRSGYLRCLVFVNGELYRGRDYPATLGQQLIEVPYLNYQLQYDSPEYFQQTRIKIKQLSLIEQSKIIMQVTLGASSLPQVGEDIFSEVIPVSPTSTTPVFLIAAARSRRAAKITNQTNQSLYLKGGAAASSPTLIAGNPFTLVPAGGSYSFEDYSGDIVGIMKADFAIGGKIIVTQSPYIVEAPAQVEQPSA